MENKYLLVDILENIIYKNFIDYDSLDSIYMLIKDRKDIPDYLNILTIDLELNIGTLSNELENKIYIVINKLNGTFSKNETEEGVILNYIFNEFPEIKTYSKDVFRTFYIYDEKYITDGFNSMMGSIGQYVHILFSKKEFEKMKKITEFLEENFNKSENISEAISTGFVEAFVNQITDDNELKETLDILGPKLQGYAIGYLDWTNGIKNK